MLSKVPIFSGLNQGLEGAEGRGMFIKQNYISGKKKKYLSTLFIVHITIMNVVFSLALVVIHKIY